MTGSSSTSPFGFLHRKRAYRLIALYDMARAVPRICERATCVLSSSANDVISTLFGGESTVYRMNGETISATCRVYLVNCGYPHVRGFRRDVLGVDFTDVPGL